MQVDGEARDVVACNWFGGEAVAAEVRGYEVVVLGEGGDVAFEDGGGACEAVELWSVR